MGWACVQTYGGSEAKVIENLRRQEYDSFCPTYLKPNPLHLDKFREVPLFPCYVFVNLHPDRSWTPINNTYGVIRLLTNRNRLNPRPLFIADSFIESIEDLRRKSERKEGLPPNTIVRIRQRDHPFYDYTGTVIGMDLSSRVRVLMSLFSRELMVTLQVTDVEILSE